MVWHVDIVDGSFVFKLNDAGIAFWLITLSDGAIEQVDFAVIFTGLIVMFEAISSFAVSANGFIKAAGFTFVILGCDGELPLFVIFDDKFGA